MAAKMDFSVGGSSSLSWEDTLDVARTAEDLGFSGFYPSDHLMAGGGRAITERGPSQDRMDAPTVLAALAGHTKTLRLGALVLCNVFRHPAILAKMFAVIDQASKGRAVMGIGAGNSEGEAVRHGYPWLSNKERLAQLNEALQVIVSLWTKDETNFNGTYYKLDNVPCDPKPFQKPHIPILLGGRSTAIMRMVAKYGDEWNMHGGPKEIAERMVVMRGVCEKTERDPATIRISVQTNMVLTETKEQAEQLIRSRISALSGRPEAGPGTVYANIEEQVRDQAMVGDAEQLQERVQAYLDVGVTHLDFQTPRPFQENKGMLEKFAANVMPFFG
jgi:alkanesulfonate monooxygenase SsuD/methylene tetrahydromethanopterin reductase-like flavin-dependent oxidoreductase (luciferase family)